MISAILTTLFFSFSAAFTQRTLRFFDYRHLIVLRLSIGSLILLGIASLRPGLFDDRITLLIFLTSGVIGMGLGDLASLKAMPRLGSRLTILLIQCGAPPIAALAERVTLGTTVTVMEGLCATLILTGVCAALFPDKTTTFDPVGIWFGFLGAVGQALGAVVSRIGYAHAAGASHSIDGITAALYRNMGGLAVAIVFLLLMRRRITPMKAAGWPWLFGSALAGPVLGLVAYQQALIDTPGAIVLPIVATSPLVIIPIVWFMEQDRPSLRSLAGGTISVMGVILLALQRNAF